MLTGLVHTARIIRLVEQEDGFGGIEEDVDDPTLVKAEMECRFTNLTEKQLQLVQGRDTENLWMVIMKPFTSIVKDDLLRMSGEITVSDGDYRVIKVHQQKDEYGTHNHTSLMVEKE